MSTRLKALLAAIALVASLISAFPVLSTTAATCPAPTLLEAMVSQGLPHNGVDKSGKANPPLVRGKRTLVKFFLGLPSGALSVQIQPASRLDVFHGTTKLNTNTISPTAATSLMISSTKADDSAGDPKFSVPGTVLASSSTTGAWTANFTGVLEYATTPTVGLPCTGSISYSVSAPVAQRTGALRVLIVSMGDGTQSPGSQFTKEVQPGQKSSALQAVQDGFTALSRILPVPDGVGDLDNMTSDAGIRWHLNAGMLPLNELGIAKNPTSSKYCLNDLNFAAIATKLDTYLQAWNGAQQTATTTADRVVGVIDSNIGSGIETPGCWDGAAQINSVHAWARAIHDTGESADKIRETGPLMAMEVQHTLGLKVPTSLGGTGSSTYHSTSATADHTNPNRGYNTFTNGLVSEPRTAMELRTPFRNDNTLAEQADWADALCSLGGPTTPTCGGSHSKVTRNVGTTANVAATGRFFLNALSNGKPEGAANTFGTRITDAYYTTTKFETPDDPSSLYHFVAYDGSGATLVDKQVTLQTNTSEHPDDEHDGEHHLLPSKCPLPYTHETCGTFSFAVTLPSQLGSYEVWNGAPNASGSTRLIRRVASITPTVSSVNVTNSPAGAPVNLTNDPNAEETEPAITPDGKWLLYARTPKGVGQQPCTELVARPINANGTLGEPFYLPGGDTVDVTQTPPATICSSKKPGQSAWRADGRAGAYVQEGELHVFTFDPAKGFTSTSIVLACAGTSNLGACLSGSPTKLSAVAGPSWSPDTDWRTPVTTGSGHRLSFDADSLIAGQRDLYYLDPYSPAISVDTGQEVHPAALVVQRAAESSWSHAGGKGKTLVYSDHGASTGSPLRVVDVANSTLPTTGTQISCCGRGGSFGDRFIAIEEEADNGAPTGNIALLDYNTANPTPIPDQKTSTGKDTSPSITSTLVAGQPFSQLLVFDRQDTSHEIYLSNLNAGDRRSVLVSGTVGTANLPYASATVFVQCNGLANPYATVLEPVWSKDLGDGTTAVRFNTALDHSDVCGDPNSSDPSADAPRAGARIDDQTLVSDLVYGGGIGTTRKRPSASILHTSGTAVQSENLNLVGSGVDPWFGAISGPGAVWKVYAPDGSLYATKTGEITTVPVPASGYFAPGTWKLVFTVTNPWGLSATDTEFVKMQVPTTPASSVNFDPNSVTVPVDTSGSPNVTVYITVTGQDLRKIPKANVAITSIDGVDVSGDASLAANGWSPTATTASATFDKTALTSKIYALGGALPRKVRVTISGTSGSTAGSFGFMATDPNAPCAHLQTQGSTC